jgi:hypothetical protein
VSEKEKILTKMSFIEEIIGPNQEILLSLAWNRSNFLMSGFTEMELNKRSDKIVFSYMGKPTHEMIDLILEMSETKLRIIESNSTIVKRIVNVLIEILQNIFNHGEDFSVVDHQSFKFFLFKQGDDYFIITENFIKTKEVNNLISKLDGYLSMSDEDITRTYRKTLDNGGFSIKGGAGLGLINIIRKSNGNLEYKFSKVDKENSMFRLGVQIKVE